MTNNIDQPAAEPATQPVLKPNELAKLNSDKKWEYVLKHLSILNERVSHLESKMKN